MPKRTIDKPRKSKNYVSAYGGGIISGGRASTANQPCADRPAGAPIDDYYIPKSRERERD